MSDSRSPTETEILVVAETFKLLGDPTRLKILLACLDQPMAVGDIARHVVSDMIIHAAEHEEADGTD